MGLSPHTVWNHSTNLRRKLDVRSSLEAVIAAVRLGVLTLDEDRRGNQRILKSLGFVQHPDAKPAAPLVGGGRRRRRAEFPPKTALGAF